MKGFWATKPDESPSPPIPRVSLTWLLLAQALVIVPFVLHVPLALVGLWLACTI